MTGGPIDWVKQLGSMDPDVAANAAERLLTSSAPLQGQPPDQLLHAITLHTSLPAASILNLARAWSRTEMSRATLDALSRSTLARERLAWLLKTVLAPEHSDEALRVILDPAEDVQVRMWMLEAVERLALGGVIDWEAMAPVVAALSESPDLLLRSALPSLLMALPWRPSNLGILEALLRDTDPGVIAAAAQVLTGHPEAVRQLDPQTLDGLRRHAVAGVRDFAARLDATMVED
jgi:hypothetical protein